MAHKIVVTSPVRKDVVSTQQYVCQIHSCQHIEVRALEGGYLEEIHVQEGQAVQKGELMFKILPTIYQARLDSEAAEAQRIQIELNNAEVLLEKNIVSPQEIALIKAELAKAQAKVQLARAELSFTNVTAPFDGIVDRQFNQLGSLIEEGDVLTTFSDNSVMWVYFNVPEARYLEYKAELDKSDGRTDHLQIQLQLANGAIFPYPGKIGAIEADFDNMTGNIPFRADFPNPAGLLRNGQTGTVLIRTTLEDAVVIPQRATYEILAKQYAYVVDEDDVVHQRDITVQSEQEDIFVIEDGLNEGDRIILEGIRQVRDGDKVETEFLAPEEVLGNLKYHAE
ncbi:MAG: efflux RND transporter periplasmic adaptor subunit [Pirellulaceae bacterium]